jgi:hypothetical protein
VVISKEKQRHALVEQEWEKQALYQALVVVDVA